jgi:3-oxoadipate enol-lactonase
MTAHRERHSVLVDRGGDHVYAEQTGAGPAVVLCHGLGGNHAIWWRQINSLAHRYRVITWDQRGFGNSTNVSGQAGIDEAADDLVAILDALEVERAHLVGQSMGAFVALRTTLNQPQRVASLVLSTTLAAADPRHTRALRAAVPRRQLRDRHPVVSEAFAIAHPDLVVAYNLISSFGVKPPAEVMLESMAAHRFDDDELRAIICPVLFLAAEHDTLCPAEVMQAAANRVSAAELETLAGAAHSAYYEIPAVWTAAVLRFIDSTLEVDPVSTLREESHVD